MIVQCCQVLKMKSTVGKKYCTMDANNSVPTEMRLWIESQSATDNMIYFTIYCNFQSDVMLGLQNIEFMDSQEPERPEFPLPRSIDCVFHQKNTFSLLLKPCRLMKQYGMNWLFNAEGEQFSDLWNIKRNEERLTMFNSISWSASR